VRIVQPGVFIRRFDIERMARGLEEAGRTCYKSEGKMTDYSFETFLEDKIKRGHLSLIEHGTITVKFICDRGISHELVRHRLASFSQESTRYCNYSKEQFDNEITVIEPFFFPDIVSSDFTLRDEWEYGMLSAEKAYMKLLKKGAKPQEARSVLPNSLKTEIWMTANIREWRHIFEQRCSKAAHPQMRQIMLPFYYALSAEMPYLFEDINKREDFDRDFPSEHMAQVTWID
jgi:thymidylate synthase (FAD)